MRSKPSQNLLTTYEAAKASGYSPAYISSLCRSGELPSTRKGKAWMIKRADLKTHLSKVESEKKRQAEQLARKRKDEYWEVQRREQNLLTTYEAAKASGYSPAYISSLCRSGELPSTRNGKAWAIKADDLQAYLAKVEEEKKKLHEELAEKRKSEYREIQPVATISRFAVSERNFPYSPVHTYTRAAAVLFVAFIVVSTSTGAFFPKRDSLADVHSAQGSAVEAYVLTAAVPNNSSPIVQVGRSIAFFTYTTIDTFFSDAERKVAAFFAPRTNIQVMVVDTPAPVSVSNATTSAPSSSTTTISYSTTTVQNITQNITRYVTNNTDARTTVSGVSSEFLAYALSGFGEYLLRPVWLSFYALDDRFDYLADRIDDIDVGGGGTIGGDITGDSITVTGNGSIGGALTTGSTTVNGGLTVNGDTNITGALTVGSFSVSSLSVTSSISAPSFNATSTIATSTFAGPLQFAHATGTSLSLDSLMATSSVFASVLATNATTTNATSTNLFASFFNATNGTISTFTSTLATITNAVVTTLTATNATLTNATTTNATSTNLTVSGVLRLSGLTPFRLLFADSSGAATSTDLSAWVTGTANQIAVTDNGAGGVTLSLPSNVQLGNATATTFSANSAAFGATGTTSISSTGALTTPSLTVGSLNGILRATGGAIATSLVSLATDVEDVLPVANGGTGTGTAPTYGQLLIGNGSGGYSLVSTTTLGFIDSGSLAWGNITGTLSDQADLQSALDAKLSMSTWFATTTHGSLTTLPSLSSVGTIMTGVWQGSAIAPAYLDPIVLLGTEVDTSSELASLVSDEVGTGSLVFSEAPTFSGVANFDDVIITNATSTNLFVSGQARFGTLDGVLKAEDGVLSAATAGVDYIADTTGDWTGTLDGLEGTYYLANSFSTSSANAWLTTKSTSNLTEGSNLYYTDARVLSYVDSLGKGYFFSTTSANTWFGTKSTSDLAEGSNLYYSLARFASALAGTTTDALLEGTTNRYYSDTLARAALSSTAPGLAYSSATGVFSLDAGYVIPLSASTTEWATAYGWGDHALENYFDFDLHDSDDLPEGGTNLFYSDARVATYLDTVSKGYFFSTTSANYWETQQTARTADDLTNNSIEDLSDVAAMTKSWGNLLSWNGSAWTNIATSSLGLTSTFSATYPLQYSSNILSLAFGTTTANVWGALQTFASGFVSQASSTIAGDFTVTGTTNLEDISIAGDIIPTADNVYSLGSPTHMWRDVYIGPGSLYINGQKVLEEDATTDIVVTADPTQNLKVKTTDGGNIELNANTTGQLIFKSNINVTGGKSIVTSDLSTLPIPNGVAAGNITVEDNTISASNMNGGISLAGNGTGGVYVTSGNFGIATTSPFMKFSISGNSYLGGNLTATGTVTFSGLGSGFVKSNSGVLAIAVPGVDYLDDTSGDWTGTFDGQEGSYYLANSFSTTSANYWETQQTARTADDLTNNSIEDLSDVGSMTTAFGDLLSWSGTAWSNIATSTLGIAFADIIGTVSQSQGGTGITSYNSGDILYADNAGILTALPKGANGQVLKLSGGLPSWGTDITTGGGGGAGAWSTTTDSLAIYPTDTSDTVIVGGGATTTANSILEVFGTSYFSNTLGIATTSPSPLHKLAVGGNALISGNTHLGGNLTATGTVTFSGLGSGLIKATAGVLSLATAGTDYVADTTGDWTGTFDGQEGSYYLANSFSTTSAAYWKTQNDFFSTTSSNAWLATKSTSNLTEGSNLYYTDTRVSTLLDTYGKGYFFSTTSAAYWKTQNDFFSTTSSNAWLATKSTSDLAEGTNLYYTTTRFDNRLSATTSLPNITSLASLATVGTITSGTWQGTAVADTYVSDALSISGGTINNTPIGASSPSTAIFTNATTTNATTTNLYASSAITLGSDRITDFTGTGLTNSGGALTLNATGDWTGTFDGQEGSYYLANSFSTTSAAYYLSQNTGAAFSTTSTNYWLSTKTTDNLTEGATNQYWTLGRFAGALAGTTTTALAEGTNLYYTDTRARSAISETITGITYTSGTGVFSLTSGYEIPLSASTTNWNAFYNTPSTRITAGTNLSWSGNTLNGPADSYIRGLFSAGTGLSYNSGTGAFSLDATGDWTGTFDGQEGSYYLANSFSTTSANAWLATKSTSDLAEGTNLYYTTTRFDNRLSATTSLPNITSLASLATVGTITSGTWQGTAINPTYLDSSVILSTEIDTYNELNTIVSDVTLTHNALIDTSSELAGILTDEAGTSGGFVRAGSPTFTGTATFTDLIATNATTTSATSTNLYVSGQTRIASLTGLIKGTSGVLSAATLGTDYINNSSIDTSSELATILTDETGTGAAVFAGSPTFTGTATFANLITTNATATNATSTNLYVSGQTRVASLTGVLQAISGIVSATSTISSNFLDAPVLLSTEIDTSSELATILTDETGSGALVFGTSPTLVTPNLGTPSAVTLTNATGLPVSTGISGLGTGVATWLATPSSANLATAVTGETGSGALVFGTAPTLTTLTVSSGGAAITGNSTITGTLTGLTGLSSSGTITFSGLSNGLVKATSGVLSAATAGTDYENPLTFTYPLVRSINAISLAFGTTTANSWSALQEFNAGASTTQLTTTGAAYLATVGGNVGIGATSPTGKLTVIKDGAYNSEGSTGIRIMSTESATDVALHMGTDASLDIGFIQAMQPGVSWTRALVLQGNGGNVGIGTTSPLAKLSVGGDTYIAGNLTATGTATIGSLTGPLQAVNGLVSATSTMSVGYGGTGLSTAPTYGQMLVGNASGGYTLMATSSLNIEVSSFSGILGISQGGTNEDSQTTNGVTYFDGTSITSGSNLTTDGASLTASGYLISGTQFWAPIGSAGTPSYSWGDDATTGIFNAGGSAIGFSLSGSEVARFDASGNLGIGTTTPNGRLSVVGENAVFVPNSAASAGLLNIGYDATGGSITAQVSRYDSGAVGARHLSLQPSGGNVGIGTATPSGELHVYSAGNGDIYAERSGGAQLTVSAQATAGQIGTTGSHNLQLITNSTARVTINTSGNVGIGTTTPGARLHIAADNAGSGAEQLVISGGTDSVNKRLRIGYDTTSNFGVFQALGPGPAFDDIAINPYGGDVGIGTSSPASRLHIEGGNSASGGLTISSSAGSATNRYAIYPFGNTSIAFQKLNSAGVLAFLNSTGGEEARFSTDGNFALGTTTAGARLSVQTSSTNDILNLFETGGAEVLTVLESGNVGIGTTSPLSKFSVTGTASTPYTFMVRQSDSVPEPAGMAASVVGTFQGSGHAQLVISPGNTTGLSILSLGDTADYNVGGIQYDHSTNALSFRTNDTADRMVINSSGNVGIGTTSPNSILHLYSTGDTQLDIDGTASGNPYLSFSQADATQAFIQWNNTGDYLQVSTPELYVSGNLGVGVTDSSYRFDVQDSSGGTLARFKDTDSVHDGFVITGDTNGSWIGDGAALTGEGFYFQDGSNALRAYAAGAEIFRSGTTTTVFNELAADIDFRVESQSNTHMLFVDAGSGEVGINNSSPDAVLDVKASAISSIIQQWTGTDSAVGAYLYQGATGDDVRFYLNGASGVDTVRLSANGSSFLNGGNIGIGTTTPASKLQVAGDVTALPTTGTYQQFEITGAASPTYRLSLGTLTSAVSSLVAGSGIIQSFNNGTGATPLYINPNGGNVGVGIGSGAGSADYKLDVRGSGNDLTSASIQVRSLASLGNTGAGAIFAAKASDASGFFGAFPSDYISSPFQDRVGISTNSDAGGITIGAASSGQDIRFLTGGSTERMRIDSAGNVGIGSTTPGMKLEIAFDSNGGAGTTAADGLVIRDTDNGSTWTTTDANAILDFASSDTSGVGAGVRARIGIAPVTVSGSLSRLSFFTAPTTAGTLLERLSILDDGNVGIGTIAPGSKLEILGDETTLGQLMIKGNEANDSVITLYADEGDDTGDRWNIAARADEGYFTISSRASGAWVDTLNINALGNVGVGTTSPSGKLHVFGSAVNPTPNANNDDFVIETTGQAGVTILNDNLARYAFGDAADSYIGGVIYDHAQDQMRLYVNNDDRLTITSAGNVGIGTTSPASALSVVGTQMGLYSSANANIVIDSGGTNRLGALAYQTAGTSRWFTGMPDSDIRGDGTEYFIGTSNSDPKFWIESTGSVGIGTSTATARLAVNGAGATSATTNFRLTDSNGRSMFEVNDAGFVGMSTAPSATWKLDFVGQYFQMGSDNTSNDLRTDSTTKLFGIVTPHYTNAQNPVWGIGVVNTSVSNTVYIGGGVTSGANAATGINFATNNTSTGGVGTVRMALSNTLLRIGSGDATASPAAVTLEGPRASGTNLAGTHWTMVSGKASGNANSGDFLFQTGDPTVSGTTIQTATTKLTIKGGTGFVGIGETAPGSRLSVSGGTTIGASYDTTAAPTNGLLVEGNVGIGTTSPATALHISSSGSTALTLDTQLAAGAPYITFRQLNVEKAYFQYTDNGASLDYMAYSAPAHSFVSGNVGIGTTTPTASLSISGTAPLALFKTSSNAANAFLLENASGVDTFSISTLDTNASIFSVATTSGTSYFDVTANGNVGIGSTSPRSTLTVTGSACFSGGSGSTALCGTTAGSIYYRTASTGTYDVAENYITSDLNLEASTIVALDPTTGMTITTAMPGSIPLGIVSTDPGLLLGGADPFADLDAARPVALSGRVPVKVSNANGPIMIGDRLMLSTTTPGVAVKAVRSGYTVGVALESYTSGGSGTIEAFVENQYYLAPSDIFVDNTNGRVGIGTQTPGHALQVLGDVGATGFVNTSTKAAKTDIEYVTEEEAASMLEKLEGLQIAQYHYKIENRNNPLRLGLIAEQAPSEVLSADGKGIDIYKLATFTLAGVQELAKRTDLMATKLESLEERLTQLENGSITVGTGTLSFSTTTLIATLKSFGVVIEEGFARFQTLAALRFVAATDDDGQSSAGEGEILAGNTVVEIENDFVAPNSKIFVTFTSALEGSWFIDGKEDGSFRVRLSEAQDTDVTFDYFIVQTDKEVSEEEEEPVEAPQQPQAPIETPTDPVPAPEPVVDTPPVVVDTPVAPEPTPAPEPAPVPEPVVDAPPVVIDTPAAPEPTPAPEPPSAPEPAPAPAGV